MLKDNVQHTKEHILEIAREQFFKKGYAATSINTIVDAADVTKPTVYYHFKSKEGLFAALVDEAYDRCFEHRRQSVDENSATTEAINAFSAVTGVEVRIAEEVAVRRLHSRDEDRVARDVALAAGHLRVSENPLVPRPPGDQPVDRA